MRTVVCCSLLLIACGDDSGAGPDDGGAGGDGRADAAPFPDGRRTDGGGGGGDLGAFYADAVCGHAFECCTLDEITGGSTFTVPLEDYGGCLIVFRTFADAYLFPQIEASEAAGRVTFDEEAFRGCLQAFADASCGSPLDPMALADCQMAFTGLVTDGNACQQDFECVSGYCAESGMCAPRVAESMSCAEHDQCRDGLYCDPATDLCAPRKANDQPCGSGEECQSGSCLATGVCGVTCDGGGAGVGPAPDPLLLTAGTRLIELQCGRIFECCDVSELPQMAPFNVESRLECQAILAVFIGLVLPAIHNAQQDGRVTIDAAVFEACMAAAEAQTCAERASAPEPEEDCQWLTGTVGTGLGCEQDFECVSGFCLNPSPGAAGTCQTPPGGGDACPDDGCPNTHYCDGTCQADVGLGEACSGEESCSVGTCWDAGGGAPEQCAIVCDGV